MPRCCVLTLGNFDGPHRGHLAIVERARKLAEDELPGAGAGAEVVVVTFDPPPVQVLRPGSEPPRLAGLEQRVAALRQAGADAVEVIRPTPAWLAKPAERFVAELVEQYRPRYIVEGPDFRFGHGRAGDMTLLAQLGRRYDFEAVTVPRLGVTLSDLQAVPISSSLVRWLVGHGRVADAAACLGRDFTLTAEVVRGEQQGRKLGIPTANLDLQALSSYILPADGVYAGYATLENPGVSRDPGGGDDPKDERSSIENPQSSFPAAISVGVKPTFGKADLAIEAHLLGFDGDLYGRKLTLHFARWLRDQYPFPNLAALRAQLHRDLAAAHPQPASPQVRPQLQP